MIDTPFPEIVQTLYFVNKNKNPINTSLRFLSAEFHWMCWAYSALQLKKLYGDVTLFTNNVGAEVLIDRLALPYSKVDLRLETADIDPGLIGVLPKVYTYSFQEKPFIHIDGDVIFGERLNDKCLQANLLSQNSETADFFYRSFYDTFLSENVWFPKTILDELESGNKIKVYNLGIVGGVNIEFFKKFTSLAFEIIKNNKDKLSQLGHSNFNLIYEQHLFYCLTQECRQNVVCYKEEDVVDLDFTGYADFIGTPQKNKFVHLLGDFKLREDCCLQLARRFRRDYPDYYYKIIDECKKANVRFYLTYYQPPVEPSNNQECIGRAEIKSNEDEIYDYEKNMFSLIDYSFSEPKNLHNILFCRSRKLNFQQFFDDPSEEDKDKKTVKIYSALLQKDTELVLDILDQELFIMLEQPKTYSDIVELSKELFDDDLEDDLSMLEQLITQRLKSGVEDGLFDIAPFRV